MLVMGGEVADAELCAIVSRRSGPRWYAVYTGPRCERRVQKRLERLGYPTIVLLYEHRQGNHTAIRNLLRRYIFARFDERADPWPVITETDGVIEIVSNDDRPVAVPEEILGKFAMECLTGFHNRRSAPLDAVSSGLTSGQRRVSNRHRQTKRQKRAARKAAKIAKQWLANAREIG